MSNVQYGLVMQELERADSGLRSFVSVQSALVMHPIHAFGSDEQKQRWLPALQQGKAIGCFGLTEPDFGSNPGGMRTRAVKEDGDYILNGEKTWITNGSIADVALVWARTPEGVRGFLVERGTPGFSTKDIKGKMSLRASVTSSLSLSRRSSACREHAACSHGFEICPRLPDAGTLRDRLGCRGRRHGLLQRSS